ncbi:hypothetical protein L1987_39000 [Smallanthus sonchifolius]|uniref:Uncharacterized protein n=1 Tax=Smallanthus sonchifolius TaxID=185202 RepID=A0ACB9HNA2_9ASTR|nr:hypothetical protein L1987_39000 [Smallanthus sonchifolius]
MNIPFITSFPSNQNPNRRTLILSLIHLQQPIFKIKGSNRLSRQSWQLNSTISSRLRRFIDGNFLTDIMDMQVRICREKRTCAIYAMRKTKKSEMLCRDIKPHNLLLDRYGHLRV